MKKHITCMTAAVFCLSLAACTGQTPPEPIPGEPSGASMEVALSHSYRSQRLETDSDVIQLLPGDRALMRSYPDEGTYNYTLCDLNTGSMIGEPLALETERFCGAQAVGDDIELFYQVWSDVEKKAHSYILTCDSALKPISEEEVSDLWREAETPSPAWGIDTLSAFSWVKDAQGNEYLGGGDGLWCKTPDNVLHQIQGVGASSKLFFDRKGRLYSVYDSQTIRLVDTESFTAGTVSLSNLPKQSFNNGQYAAGNSTYDFTYSDGVSVFGVKLDEGVSEELMHWEDSDFMGTGETYRLLEDGRIVVTARNGNYLASARTQEEVDTIQLISLANPWDTGYSNDDYLTEMAHQFNREHDGYRIVIRSYDPEQTMDGWDKLEADLLAGIVPDMIMGDGSGFNNYESFSNMGLFEDWKPWMENDPDFHKEDYLYNVFEALSYKGRMEQIAFTVTAEAYFAKAEYLNESGMLTADDLQALSGEMMLYGGERRTAANSYGFQNSLGAFIDYASGTCSFDSPEFVQLLELFGTLPEKAPVEDEDAYRNGDILLSFSYGLSPQAYHDAVETFGTEDIAIVGNPFIGEKGKGGWFRANCPVVVSSQSQYKELIWEYIKFCLREDNQSLMMTTYDPVNLAVLEANYQANCEADPHTYWVNEVAVTKYPPTSEESETVLEALRSITASENNNTFITSIVCEEAGMYFSGDCTAQEAAERMQGRVSLYLAERK